MSEEHVKEVTIRTCCWWTSNFVMSSDMFERGRVVIKVAKDLNV